MARLGRTFDATARGADQGLEVLPPGRYPAQIVASEMRPTKAGRADLWLELDLLEGEHQGRKLFDRLNLINPNPQTVEIAQRTLGAICHATGRLQVRTARSCTSSPSWSGSSSSPTATTRSRATSRWAGSRPRGPPRPRRSKLLQPQARPARRTGRAAGASGQHDRALEEERLIRKQAAPSPIEFGDTAATALSPQPFGERPWRTGR